MFIEMRKKCTKIHYKTKTKQEILDCRIFRQKSIKINKQQQQKNPKEFQVDVFAVFDKCEKQSRQYLFGMHGVKNILNYLFYNTRCIPY